MRFAPRALILLALVAVPMALYSVSPLLLYVGLAYVGLLVAMVAVDHLTCPLYSHIEVQRQVDSRLSLGAENLVTVHVINRSRHTLRLRIKDDFPTVFRFDRVYHPCEIPPCSATELRYHLTPLRRGLYHFGDTHVECWGVLGLIIRRQQFNTRAAAKVYPNLLEIRQYELLTRRGMLQEIGLKHSRRFGEGTELERLREYHPDDEFRRIDWKATSRRHQPIVREFETERSQEVMLMLDTGRLMTTPLGPLMKLDHAINASLMASYVAALKGDKVGLLTFSDQVCQYVAPRSGKRQFHTMLEMLYDVQGQLTEPSFQQAFTYLASRQRKRALIILFTDILGEESARALSDYIGRLAKHHLVACVTLSDPGILAMAQQPSRQPAMVYQKVMAEKLLQEKRDTLGILSRSGVLPLDVPADQLTMTVVNKYLELKARSRL